MILEFKQIKSVGENQFQMTENGTLLYVSTSPWTPLSAEFTRNLTMTNSAGQLVFQTEYNYIENALEEAVPFKYLLTGQQRFNSFKVKDSFGNEVGAFYVEVNNIADAKMYLLFNGRVLVAYRLQNGPREFISFYENDAQIGQTTRWNATVNNMDTYHIHFLPGYENLLPILTFFMTYYDFVYHNNTSEAMIGYKVSYTYTYSKNSDKYDSQFILRNFGPEENDRISGKGPNSIKPEAKVGNLSMKTFWIIFGVGWFVALLIAGIVCLLLFL